MAALRPVPEGALAPFKAILLQDGSSMAVHSGLSEIYPGRFSANSPAAIELHATMNLYEDQPIAATLTPDVDGERTYLPEPETMASKRVLADRGYFSKEYISAVDAAAGCYIIRAPSQINPVVVECRVQTKRGWKRKRTLEGRKFRTVRPAIGKRDAELIVEWQDGVSRIRTRLVLIYNPVHGPHMLLATNLTGPAYSVTVIRDIYRLLAQRPCITVLRVIFAFLARYAGRAHPKRDRKPGRLKIGLQPAFAGVSAPPQSA